MRMNDMTLAQVGLCLNITRERVRQIQNRALARLTSRHAHINKERPDVPQ